VKVETEDLVNAATAISGSGTGYVAYFIENMVEAGQALGFSQEQACALVAQTFRGAVNLWEALQVTPAQLRISVTSPGGTTAAAIEVFERLGLGQGIQAGMQAAKQRADEL
jgi:pyrroline-5-carboxylate reductase